jgi:hypothetical protein
MTEGRMSGRSTVKAKRSLRSSLAETRNHRLFLYRGDGLAGVTMTLGAQLTDGTWATGVDANRLAAHLGLTADALFAHNNSGTLFIAVRREPPAHGGASATSYRFRVGQAEAVLTFEDGVHEARA